MMRSRTWLSVLLLLAVAAPAVAGPPTQDVSVCEISRHPGRFVGKRVRVSARLIGNWTHGFMLIDTSACEGALLFDLPDDKSTDGRISNLRSIVEPWRAGRKAQTDPTDESSRWPDEDVEVTLTGTIATLTMFKDDWSGSFAAGSAHLSDGKPRPTGVRTYLKVYAVEGLRIYNLQRYRYQIDRDPKTSGDDSKSD